ncbi:MAG: ribosome silencing factor [Candidatus Omnitrophica bacterium]|nr:ribosome silencing factor [Candidatus Omnitrophota bacterium]
MFKILEEKQALETKILDVRKITWITDYFIITSVQSAVQAKAILDSIIENFDEKPLSVEGTNSNNWILMDYGEIIIHIFNPEARLFYNLEKLWADAKEIKIIEEKTS